jgi:DNA-binding transcriptional regulator YiaG
MAKRQFRRVLRPATAEERKRHAEIREKVMREFPPAPRAKRRESPPGIPAEIRRAREAKGLTWYALARLAGIPNPNTVRDIEYGRDAQLSSLQAVAKVLRLRLELVEESQGAVYAKE